jgi:hypothetical protein
MSTTVIPGSPAKLYSRAARFGLTAKGFVYCLSGLIALLAGLHFGSKSADDAGKQEVFNVVKDQPFGKWIILAIALGLLCYTGWRFLQAFADTEHKGDNKKGISKRAAYFFSGLAYGGLTAYSFKVFIGSASDNNSRQKWVATLLDKPYGSILVIILGLIFIGTGCYQVYRAVSGKYKKYVREALHKDTAPWIIAIGTLGYIARGIIWMIVGWLFIKAGLHTNSKEAGGSDAAFQWIQHSSYGSLLLVVISSGLICYGLFSFLRARYQVIHL